MITTTTVHKEDISTLAAGTVLIGSPCKVWSIVVSVEADGDPVINFSNTATAYSNTYRILKTILCTEQKTVNLVFPNGLYCSSGLCATSNVGSVDISVNYE